MKMLSSPRADVVDGDLSRQTVPERVDRLILHQNFVEGSEVWILALDQRSRFVSPVSVKPLAQLAEVLAA